MIDIVFCDSAGGSLRQAQHYGQGRYHGSIGVIVSHADGSKPVEEEIALARQTIEEQARLEWESATPMGGNLADIYSLSFGLSIGDISESVPGEKRRQALEWLYSIHPESGDIAQALINKGVEALNKACRRISAGESARIWYSSKPDELCGLHWFMEQISHLDLKIGQVSLAALPDWEEQTDGSITVHSGWGGVKPGEWHRYLELQKAASPAFCAYCALSWQRLRQENAPLRAVLNGRLVSAPETLYDHFILREIDSQPDEFQEAMVIGKVLGKYELGVGDCWVAHRIEGMISEGRLIPVTEPEPDSPIYHRRLKKTWNN